MMMNKLHKLIDTFRKRASGLQEAANECTSSADRFALQVRADEAASCATALEKVVAEVGGARSCEETELTGGAS